MSDTGMPAGTGSISQHEAVEALLGRQAPAEEPVSETVEEQEADTEEVEASPEDEAEDEAGVETQAEDEAEEEGELEEVEVEEETLYTVKVDGKQQDVSIEDLVKSFQLESTAQKRLSDAADQRKQIDADRTAVAQERDRYAQGLQQIAATLQAQQHSEADLAKLKEDDPFAYQEAKVAQLERTEAARRIAGEQQQLFQQKIAQESAQLVERIPEWRDPEVRRREQDAVVTFAKRVGFTDQELSQASDSRAIEVLRKAHLYEELMKNEVPKVKKKVAKAKRMVKAGQPKTQMQVKSDNQRKAYERFAKAGSKDAAVEYLLNKT